MPAHDAFGILLMGVGIGLVICGLPDTRFGRWFKSLFAWREIHRAGVFIYQENAVTGERRARRYLRTGYSPLDRAWLEHRPETPIPPPSDGSAVQRPSPPPMRRVRRGLGTPPLW